MPMCANSELLPKVRRDWAFDGYITSDCGAVGNPNYKRAGWESAVDQVTKSLEAGLDSDCGNGHDQWARSISPLLSIGLVPLALADAALSRLFAVQFRLGMFDRPEAQPPWAQLGAEAVNTPANRETVLAAAAQGLVLLVNKKQTLPFSASKVQSLALVGPNVENIVTKDCGVRKEPSYLGCEGCYCANAVDPVSPRQGFAMHSRSVEFVAGCSSIMCDPEEKDGWADAARAAGGADATVVIVGLDVTQECEGHDRENVTAPGGQNAFVRQVCDAAAAGAHNKLQREGPLSHNHHHHHHHHHFASTCAAWHHPLTWVANRCSRQAVRGAGDVGQRGRQRGDGSLAVRRCRDVGGLPRRARRRSNCQRCLWSVG